MPGRIGAGTIPGEEELNYVLVFHDQSHDTIPTAKQLLASAKQSHLLKNVVDASSAALRRATPAAGRYSFPSIEHALHVCESRGEEDAVSESILSCFNQFGQLALLWDQQHYHLLEHPARIKSIGLCTGSLAASAALFIASEGDIIRIASDFIAIAYRIGLEINRRSRAIDPKVASWSFALKDVPKDEARKALDEFNQRNSLPLHKQAYISAILLKSLTISGPPSTLEMLIGQGREFPNARYRSLGIYGAFHASHLIAPDMEKIIGDACLDSYKKQPNRSLIYPEFHDSETESLTSLTRLAIQRCFQNVLNMEGSASPFLPDIDLSTYRLISIGDSGHAENVQEWLVGSQHIPQMNVELSLPHSVTDDIAIVGYAGRFPQAENLDEFWDIIVSGKDVHEYIPKDRFDAQRHFDKTARGKNTTSSPYGCFLKQPGAFDTAFFNLSPREALSMDPTQRLLLTVTQEALDMAGYSKSAVANKRIGTFFGQATDDWRESHASQNIDIFYVGGGMRAFAPGRLNYHYKWEGPSYSLDAACSSSLVALEFAYKAVQSGDCDIAVAGGGNIISALPMFSGLSKGKFTSPTGSCRTFDVSADGYCRGEGVGVVIIKRLRDALADNDGVRGLISGIRTNHSANASSITHPHAPAQAKLMQSTLDMTGLKSHQIDYVEFHGTGTQAGDAIELSSVGSTFGDSKRRKNPLYIGAVKANVGHGEAAAGVTSLIKALLMLKHDTVPPHAGIKSESNAALKEGKSGQLVVPDKAFPFDKSLDIPRKIMINNFNATGGNTSMILSGFIQEEIKQGSKDLSHYPVAISSRSSNAFTSNLQRLKSYLAANPRVSLADLSHTTTARRQHFPYREVIVADSLEGVSKGIESYLEKDVPNPVNTPATAVFVFAGQGTQSQGIAAELFRDHIPFRQILTGYNELCSSLGFPSFLEFVTDPDSSQKRTSVQLQLGVVAVEMALAKLWQEFGIFPTAVIGHSLGEYPALCVAGVISLADMFYLVGQRAKLMEEHCEPYTQAMLSVSQSAEETEKLLEKEGLKDCGIACYNSDKAVALSGPIESLDKVGQKLKENSVKSKRLDVRYAFHSSMMDPILEPYRNIAEPIPFIKPEIAVASTLVGSMITEEGTFNAQYVVDQARNPVNFRGALKAYQNFAKDLDNTVWIELGPGSPACLPLIQGSGMAQDRTCLIPSFDTRSQCWETISRGLSNCYKHGIDVDWMKLFESTSEHPPELLDLPHYSFDSKSYWFPSQAPIGEEQTKPQQRLGPLLHFVEDVSNDGKTCIVEFSCDLSDPKLFKAIHGHLVFKAALCPSSVYSTIALEAATYLHNEIEGTEGSRPQFNLYNMEIQQPLIVQESTKATLKVSASRDLKDSVVSVKFVSKDGDLTMTHGACSLKITDSASWRSEWSKLDFLVQRRSDDLDSSFDDSLDRLNRAVIYKLFSHVVEYDTAYHGMKSIVLDNKEQEATAEVGFDSNGEQQHIYDWNLLDTLIHLPGFVLNNGIDDAQNAFISDGWSALMIPPNLKKTDLYTCYTRLSPDEDGKVFSGDVYALSQGKIVAACTGVRFVRMGRKSLRSFISNNASRAQSRAPSPTGGTSHGGSRAASSRSNTKAEVPKSSGGTDIVEKATRIIAGESGVSLDQISDKATVQELGLDSILVTQVVDRIKQEVGLEISADTISSASSFGELKEAIVKLSEQNQTGRSGESKQANGMRDHSEINGMNGYTKQTNGANGHSKQPTSSASNSDKSGKGSTKESTSAQNIGDAFRDIIAQETDVPADKVEQAGNLNEVGLDSLLTSEVLSLVQERTRREFPSSFLKENTSMKAIRATLEENQASSGKQSSSSSTSSGRGSPKDTNGNQGHQKNQQQKREVPLKRKCKITFLQGEKDSSKPPLILLPPGMGTTAIYTRFPTNPNKIPMYALQSPFLDTSSSEDYSMEDAAEAYIEDIKTICPFGPLHMGGWSIGGALAYEVSRRLLAVGRKVISLIIIDCPSPDPLKDTPKITTEALIMMGYEDFTTARHGTFPRYLTEHVVGAMNSFRTYDPISMSEDARPDYAYFVSATQGSQENFMKRAIASQQILDQMGIKDDRYDVDKARSMLDEQSPDTADFVTTPKKDPRDIGWDRFIGGDVDIKVIEADHISLLLEDDPLEIMTAYIYESLAQQSL